MPGGPTATGAGVGTYSAKSNVAGIMMTTFSAFGGLLFGYDTGTISGVKEMKSWLQKFGFEKAGTATGYAISPANESLVVSILSVGTFIGALLGAPVGDFIGRKYGIIAACAVFAIGIVLQVVASSLVAFDIGRVFAGLGVGLISCLVPMYQAECAPKAFRGAVTSAYQFCITIGILLAAIMNYVTQHRDGPSAYQIPISLQFVWAAILVVGMFLLPESPRWLVKQSRDYEATRSLCKLTGAKDESDQFVQLELREIQDNLKTERDLGESGYLDCFKTSANNKIWFRTLTGILIQMFQQLTGINFIFYYGTTFFLNSGIKNPFVISIVTNVVNVVSTIPGMMLIDKVGRRQLLLWGAVGMAICEFIVAAVGVSIPQSNLAGQKVLIAFVCVYIAFFAATWGPVAWVVTGEIFPLQVRAKATSLSVASNWLWNFAIGYATPFLVNVAPHCAGLGPRVFFIWGSTCAMCAVFTYFFVPETKGLSLEQIDDMYKDTWPSGSPNYRKRMSLRNDAEAASTGGEFKRRNTFGSNVSSSSRRSDSPKK